MKRNTQILAASLFLFLSFHNQSQAQEVAAKTASKPALQIQFPVEKYQLKNGLTVILAEDHSVPMVSYHTWYRVGSRDESLGVTGAAHMLEHMMFKGAKKYSGKQFDDVLHQNGIVNNAFTTSDYTGYYENLPSSKLELIMDMEVDRMRNLAIKAEDLTSELQVVGEERRWRVDNNPNGLLRELMMGTIYKVHPYTWPVIGYMKDIQAYTPEKLRKFYDQYYVPNNAVLVLAGDFDREKTKALIEKYYGSLESRPVPEKKFAKEPLVNKPRFESLEWDVQNQSFAVAFPGMESGHVDSYALDLAANILGGGSSSRLHKSLVYNKQIARGVGVSNSTTADPGIFMVWTAMKPGQDYKAAEKEVLAQLDTIKNRPVSAKELDKAKNQVMMDYLEGMTTIDGKAQSLAINEIYYGDYQRLFSDLERYNAVTVADVQRVSKKYLNMDARVTALLKPKKK